MQTLRKLPIASPRTPDSSSNVVESLIAAARPAPKYWLEAARASTVWTRSRGLWTDRLRTARPTDRAEYPGAAHRQRAPASWRAHVQRVPRNDRRSHSADR